MSNNTQTIIGPTLPNIPWEEKPADCFEMMWRLQYNPIIPRDLFLSSHQLTS